MMTKREIIFLIALGVMMFTIALLKKSTSFEMTEGLEYFLTVFIGFPFGLWVALDPERIRKGK